MTRTALLLLLLTCAACSESTAPREDARRALLRGMGEGIFIPTYRELELRTEQLVEWTANLCDQPEAELLEAAQDAWWDAHAPLKQNEVLRFGPYVDEPERYGPKLDFWPARPDAIEARLASDDELSEERVASFGSAERGFPVIEYLLFESELESFSEEPRRCDYLRALTADVRANVTALREAWDPEAGNYLDELVYAGHGQRAFRTVDLALGEIVNRLVFTVENVRGDKLGVVAGARSDGKPQPASAESRFSGRSLEDVRDNLRGVEQVVFGVPTQAEPASLSVQLARVGRDDVSDALTSAFSASYAAIDAIPEPLTDAVAADPAPVLSAVDELSNLQRLLQVDVIHALGLVLTFNDNDGD